MVRSKNNNVDKTATKPKTTAQMDKESDPKFGSNDADNSPVAETKDQNDQPIQDVAGIRETCREGPPGLANSIIARAGSLKDAKALMAQWRKKKEIRSARFGRFGYAQKVDPPPESPTGPK